MKFGVWLPDFAWPTERSWESVAYLKEWCVKVDHAGVDIWVIDHLLEAPGLYGGSWLDPMGMLSFAAALTRDVKLGTAILVLPVRNPVILAKEIASLQVLSDGRFAFGVGPGWNKAEFDVTGTRIEERGKRTDEMIDAVRALLEKESASYHGRFYNFDQLSVKPFYGKMPEVWVAGGSRQPDPTADASIHDVAQLSGSVLERIIRHGHWLSRCTGKQEWVIRDWAHIKQTCAERNVAPPIFAHTNFTYFTPFKNRDAALDAQKPYFMRAMGDRRGWDHLQESYMLGTLSDIIIRIEELAAAGCTYLVLGPVSADPYQLDTLLKEVVPRFP